MSYELIQQTCNEYFLSSFHEQTGTLSRTCSSQSPCSCGIAWFCTCHSSQLKAASSFSMSRQKKSWLLPFPSLLLCTCLLIACYPSAFAFVYVGSLFHSLMEVWHLGGFPPASHTPRLKEQHCSSSLGIDDFMSFVENDSVSIMNSIPIIVLISCICGFRHVS